MTDQNPVPQTAQLNRQDIPEEWTWSSRDLFPDWSVWQHELNAFSALVGQITEKKTGWTNSAAQMADLFDFITRADSLGTRLYTFCSLHSDTDMAASVYQANKGKIRHLVTQMSGELSFIEPDIIALGAQTARMFLAQEPRLSPYRRKIESVLHLAPHTLDTEAERIVALTQHFSGIPGQAASLLNNVDMPDWPIRLEEEGRIKLNWQSYTRFRTSAHSGDRRKVMGKFWRKHAQYRHTQAALLDGVVKAHFFNAQVHRFDSCLEASLKPQEIATDVYHTLISTLRAEREPLHLYLREKTRRLSISPFKYEDIYASAIPQSQRFFSYEEACELITEAMAPLGEDYINRLKTGLNGGWTDRYPNKNKRSGAYSNGAVTDSHPFVLMNYDGQWNSVSTLAHEFGHAIHSDLSNTHQHPSTSQYPIFLAEIASTLNETLLIEHMMKKTGDDRFKAFLLDQSLEELRGTLYRQTLFAEFELVIHRHIEEGNTLTADWLDDQYLSLTRYYYGHKEKVTRVGSFIANEWSAIPHFFYNFYVYQYSTGIIAAISFAKEILSGNTLVRDAYLDMLRSGDSHPPLESLKRAGLDLTRPEPIQTCLNHMTHLIEKLESIKL